MTDIKLICLDMDGPLLGADHATVPARNVRALRAASERGTAVAVASFLDLYQLVIVKMHKNSSVL